jgi:hypothetical protein
LIAFSMRMGAVTGECGVVRQRYGWWGSRLIGAG